MKDGIVKPDPDGNQSDKPWIDCSSAFLSLRILPRIFGGPGRLKVIIQFFEEGLESGNCFSLNLPCTIDIPKNVDSLKVREWKH